MKKKLYPLMLFLIVNYISFGQRDINLNTLIDFYARPYIVCKAILEESNFKFKEHLFLSDAIDRFSIFTKKDEYNYEEVIICYKNPKKFSPISPIEIVNYTTNNPSFFKKLKEEIDYFDVDPIPKENYTDKQGYYHQIYKGNKLVGTDYITIHFMKHSNEIPSTGDKVFISFKYSIKK